ncbi:MAG: M48 family metallopeptidase [Betaproteobacteria bacterium]|nr:M48 family metallopeptidase [Betaproteobacteria bacterium]
MYRHFLAVILILAIPLLGIVTSQLAGARMERNFQKELQQDAATEPAAAKALQDGVTLKAWCRSALADPATEPEHAAECRSLGRMAWLGAGSVFTLLLGFGLLGGILWAAKVAANDRDKLLKLFAPGVRYVLFGLFALILLQSLIGSYSLIALQAAYLKRINWTIPLLILLGGVLGSFFMLKEGLSVFKRVETEVVGIALLPKDQTVLWQFIERIAKRLKATPPKNLIVGLEPTFYVTSADVKVQPKGFSHRGETLYLSLPLMRILSLPELAAVIGHELGHFRGEDTKFSMEFYPVYAGSARALESLQSGDDSIATKAALFPAMAILALFFDRFAVAESAIGRARELEADKAGASVASPMAIALSLLKIGAYAPLWEKLQDDLFTAAEEGKPLANASKRFVEEAVQSTTKVKPSALAIVASESLPHPTDSHPPTEERIESLGLKFSDVQKQSLAVDPATASSRLIAGLEVIEEKLTEMELAAIRTWMARRDDDDDED